MSVMIMGVGEAASRLGVSSQRVRALINAGLLEATEISGRYVVDDDSLDALAGHVRHTAIRAFSRRIAWSAAALADGVRPTWISQSELSRLRTRMTNAEADVDAWRARIRARAGSRATYRLGRTRLDSLLSSAGVARSGTVATNLVTDRQVGDAGVAVWLATRDQRDHLIKTFGLLASSSGNVTVRTADVAGLDQVGTGVDAYRMIVAGDLLDSTDARGRHAGAELLVSALSERRWQHAA